MFRDGVGDIGVIASVTEPFCENCDRVRVTAEGQFRTCLFALDETDLRVRAARGSRARRRPRRPARRRDRRRGRHQVGRPPHRPGRLHPARPVDEPDRRLSARGSSGRLRSWICPVPLHFRPMPPEFTHLDPLGRARMVDVTAKEPTHRRAVARCRVYMEAETASTIAAGAITKGDVLAVARVAGHPGGQADPEPAAAVPPAARRLGATSTSASRTHTSRWRPRSTPSTAPASRWRR